MEPLTVPGTLASLSAIGQYVLAAAAAAGLDKKVAYRLRLAVDEIATNVITHGYDEANRTGVIDIRAEIDETALTIFLEDTGAAYHPEEVSKPTGLHQPWKSDRWAAWEFIWLFKAWINFSMNALITAIGTPSSYTEVGRGDGNRTDTFTPEV